jgi:hypothetical protein
MQWRNTAGGYLREVLTAKVYDVAVETPLEVAEKLRYTRRCSTPPSWHFHGSRAASARAASCCRGIEPGNGAQAVAWLAPRSHAAALPRFSPLPLALCCSEACGNTILLKREDLQPVKSFKLRGAYNKMAQLSAEQVGGAQRRRSISACECGCHQQSRARASVQLSWDTPGG